MLIYKKKYLVVGEILTKKINKCTKIHTTKINVANLSKIAANKC